MQNFQLSKISIVESNLESIWYTINDGVTNYTIYPQFLQSTINQIAWDAAPYGNITIRFYAKDKAGNIGIKSVTVRKEPPEQEDGNGDNGDGIIPGYNLFFLFGVLSVVSIILSKKIKKS